MSSRTFAHLASILFVFCGCGGGGSGSGSTGSGEGGGGGWGSGATGSGTTTSSTGAGGTGAKDSTSAQTGAGGQGGGSAQSGAGGGAQSGVGGQGGAGGCGGITYEGICQGDTLIWCENDMLKMADCAAMGKVCGYQDPIVGYNCLSKGGFGYPVGDKTTWPAGGWVVTQVLGNYLSGVGGHLANDIAIGESATANAPVYSVADGVVLYAGSNTSSYVNVVLIEHDVAGQKVCSFYGHLGSITVSSGQAVARGDQIATVLDWNAHFGAPNSHLHYVLLSHDLCMASDAANGALVCGYDYTSGPNGIVDLATEPAAYTSIGDVCGTQNYPNAFLSPSQFIEAHHF